MTVYANSAVLQMALLGLALLTSAEEGKVLTHAKPCNSMCIKLLPNTSRFSSSAKEWPLFFLTSYTYAKMFGKAKRKLLWRLPFISFFSSSIRILGFFGNAGMRLILYPSAFSITHSLKSSKHKLLVEAYHDLVLCTYFASPIPNDKYERTIRLVNVIKATHVCFFYELFWGPSAL